MATLIYVANTNVLELQGLKSAIEDTFINDAAVEVTVKDKDGNAVAGQTWPWTMTYVASSDGIYRAILKDGLVLVAGSVYTAFIDADGGPDRIGHWEFPFTAKVRVESSLMTDLFDDLPDIFTDPDTGFGEEISYSSNETGTVSTINGIWIDRPIVQGMFPMADAPAVTLEVRTADVPSPTEGDEVTRVATGQIMKVIPPIKPDNYGMTSLALEKIDE